MLSEISQTQRKGTCVFSNMPELGNIWDTRGTPDNGGDPQWSQGEKGGEGKG